jgi:hypothetical protein
VLAGAAVTAPLARLSEAGNQEAPRTLPAVQAAIAKARPLIAGFSNRVETVPLGGYGLPGPSRWRRAAASSASTSS